VCGPLFAFATVAKTWVNPGTLAETCTVPFGIPCVLSGVRVTTDGCDAPQVNGPTVEVMSIVGCPEASSVSAVAVQVIEWAVVDDEPDAVKQPSTPGPGPLDRIGVTLMRLMCSCTYTVTGALTTPLDDAVIWAVPAPPGVQTTGIVRLSQVPAHARPLLAILTTEGLLDE